MPILDEITESTALVKRKKRGPSFWVNVGMLVVLAALIAAAQKMSEKWIEPTPSPLPEEAMERHIVLEDLETEKPLVESESVAVPSVTETQPEEKAVEEKAAEEKPSAKPKTAPVKKYKKTVRKPSPYARDPYTTGGTLDLDLPENREKYFPDQPKSGVIKTKVPATRQPQAEAGALPLFPSERDLFIPFEKD